jgi:hypothetical protein
MAKPSIKDLLSSSTLTFTGTVEGAGASMVPGVDPDRRTVVVRVDQVLRSPPAMGVPAGSRVTVQLSPDLPPLAEGDAATFFANGLVYGENLAVTEAGRVPPAATAGATGRLAGLEEAISPVQAAMAELDEDEVVEHARQADAVVRGHVIGLAHAPKEGPPREHDPDWWIATLEVDVLARGELPGGWKAGGTVSVLYANSLDVRWRQAPKPKAGQAGLWLLHKTPNDLAAFASFQLIHPIDRQPSIRLDVLRERGLVSAQTRAEEDTVGA